MTRLLGVLLCAGLVLGCGTAPKEGATQPAGGQNSGQPTAPAPASKVDPDATLRVVIESAPPHLDNQLTLARLGRTVTDPINVFLVKFDAQMNLHPYLATKWEQTDATTWRFTLHQGVKFHNGRELVADDVKKSWQRVMDPAAGSPLRADFATVADVNAVDKYTVEFKLKSPFAPLLAKLAYLAIIPMEVVQKQGDMKKAPMGAGPYKFVEWKQDQQVVLERFDDYFEDKAKTKQLVFKFFPEYTVGMSAVEKGEADVHLWVKVTDIDRLKQSKDVKLMPNNLTGAYFIGFNTTRKPWQDVRLRQATMLGMDRNVIVQVAFGGNGSAQAHPMLAGSFWDDPALALKPDVEKAKALVKEAGFSGEYTLLAPNTPIEGPLGQIVQAQLQTLGMKVKLEVLEVPAYLDRVFTKKDYDLMVIGHSYADPDDALNKYYYSTGPNNVFGNNSPKFDALLDAGIKETDANKRKQIYLQAMQQLIADAPVVYLAGETRNSAYRSNLSGLVLKPNNTYEFHNVEIRK
jgi:peptide/nickel transport system substrate-binding protein